MKRLRVAVLTHEDCVPPQTLEGLDARQVLQVRTEYDVVRALETLGHAVQVVGLSAELEPIRRSVEEWQPQVLFNLMMEFRDEGAFQVHLASYLELLGLRYTGCSSRGILLSRDKELCKKILRYHRIPTPAFAVFRRGRALRRPAALRFPLIVKTVDEEASLGISQASVVRDEQQLRERITFVHERMDCDALAEEYVQGRELNVSMLGNQRLQILPVWEMVFEKLPEGSEPIATEHAKWDPVYQKRVGIDTRAADNLSDDVRARIARLARRAYRALGLCGYARLDLRLDEQDRVWVIEANAMPDVARAEDFAAAAAAAGLEYEALIQRILNLALRQPPRGPTRSSA